MYNAFAGNGRAEKTVWHRNQRKLYQKRALAKLVSGIVCDVPCNRNSGQAMVIACAKKFPWGYKGFPTLKSKIERNGQNSSPQKAGHLPIKALHFLPIYHAHKHIKTERTPHRQLYIIAVSFVRVHMGKNP